MAEVKPFSEAAPGTYSSFANDERCYEVHYVTDDSFEGVLEAIDALRQQDRTLIDYDINYDSVVERWVGVTCRDYEVD